MKVTAGGNPNPQESIALLMEEISRLRRLISGHSCNYKIGHPLIKEPCPLCKETGKDKP